MLQTTTTIIETATLAGTTGLSAKTVVQEDEDGNKILNKKRAAIATSLSSTAAMATYGQQQESLNDTLNSQNAQAFVESLSDDELAKLEQALIEKAQILDNTTKDKKQYVKK